MRTYKDVRLTRSQHQWVRVYEDEAALSYEETAWRLANWNGWDTYDSTQEIVDCGEE